MLGIPQDNYCLKSKYSQPEPWLAQNMTDSFLIDIQYIYIKCRNVENFRHD